MRRTPRVALVLEIPLRRLDPDLVMPAYATEGDAGADLVAAEPMTLAPGGGRGLVPTGAAIAIPAGYAGFVQPRSGLAMKHGVTCLNTPGLIDSGYRGELKVLLVNTDPSEPFTIERGDRVAMSQRTNHSQRIISELRNALDHSIGGDISRNLESLYDFMFHEHLEMMVDQETRHVDNCIRVITPLLDAWRNVPVGSGEQAARDHARGLLKVPGGPENATEESHSPSRQEAPPEGSAPGTVAEKSELVSVSA